MSAIIYAIPGLGTNDKLFSRIKLHGAQLIVLKWPETKDTYTLKEYAEKFIDQIDTSKPFYLMGVSFGGMICSELSHILHPEKIILISSCKNRNELPPLVKLFRYLPVYKLIPENIIRKFAFKSRWILGFFKEFEREFTQMINSMPKNYLKCAMNYITHWDNHKAPVNCIHIHGTADRLLLFKCVKADHAIKNGSHAMILYRAEEINKLINEIIEK